MTALGNPQLGSRTASLMLRVLIVDEQDIVRRGLRLLLGTRPDLHVVGEASAGDAALEAARALRPDLVLIEIALRGINGLNLTKALKREMPEIEVLIYTIDDREEVILEAYRAGARGYVLKSEAEANVLAAIDELAVHRSYFRGVISAVVIDRFLASAPEAQVSLTGRERELVRLVAEGKTNKETAWLLGIGVKTVETHRSSAMHKLGLHSTAELVRYAIRNDIVQP